MDVTLLGIVTEFRLVHPENAAPSMVVTLCGIVNDVKLVQPENILNADNQSLTF